ncbi:MAG: HPr family phosphocarrier protein [Kiritimatiellia bacterium]
MEEMNQPSRECEVLNAFGIHARPAALFVTTANRFKSDVFVEKDGIRVNGKSIMGLLTLEAHQGSTIVIFAKGADAAEALEALVKVVVVDKFNEE